MANPDAEFRSANFVVEPTLPGHRPRKHSRRTRIQFKVIPGSQGLRRRCQRRTVNARLFRPGRSLAIGATYSAQSNSIAADDFAVGLRSLRQDDVRTIAKTVHFEPPGLVAAMTNRNKISGLRLAESDTQDQKTGCRLVCRHRQVFASAIDKCPNSVV